MKRVDLKFSATPARTVPVHVGVRALGRLVRTLRREPLAARYAVVSDGRVARLHGADFVAAMRRQGLRAELLRFPAGERHKTPETKTRLERRLLALGVGRDGAVIALGGGVTGDLAGYLAATWQRGVPLVQAPTTLLAMVDASIGGKTGVNLPGGKNLVGALHQPRAVYADTATLDTLPDRTYREGLAELVKGAVVADRALFAWLERNVGRVLRRERAATLEAVLRGVQAKARIVARDEREAGLRAALNFGHTVGHALESVSGYRIAHGRAVALGMVVEARLAVTHRGFPESAARRLTALLERCGLPTRLPRRLDEAALLRATRADKKTRDGRPRYALPARIGAMPAGDALTTEPSDREVRRALRASN